MKTSACERATFAEGVLGSALTSRGRSFDLSALPAMSKVHKNKNVSWVSTAYVAIEGGDRRRGPFCAVLLLILLG